MSWGEFRTFLYGCAVEITWWATRPLFALIDREKGKR